MWVTVTDNHGYDYEINTDLIYMVHIPSNSIFFAGMENPMHLTRPSMEMLKDLIDAKGNFCE